MSSFIVNHKTINRILTYLRKHNWNDTELKAKFWALTEGYPTIEEELNEIGKKLIQLNGEAVRQRYNGLSKAEEELINDYQYQKEPCDIFQAYKHLCCLTYEMSEGNVPETELFQLLEKIENDLAIRIAWDITEEKGCEWEAK